MEEGELRVGNYFIKRESDYMKICDLSRVVIYSVSRRLPAGMWLEGVWARRQNGDEAAYKTLHTYVATVFAFLSTAPDDGFIADSVKAVEDNLSRHPDWYGIKTDASEKEDAEAVQAVKEMKELEDDARKLVKAARKPRKKKENAD